MKIAILFSEFLLPRPLDFTTIWDNPRGVTGSDLGVARVSQEFVKMGHDVSLFTVHAGIKPDTWDGVKLYHTTDKKNIDTSYDAIISWCEPDQFRGLPTEPIRLCSQQLNGFSYCKPGFDDFVDIWTSPSQSHMDVHKPMMSKPEKWYVVPDGCDPDIYSSKEKISGRVVYISSPDRGLHWLLQEWPSIKEKVPHASLRVFYHMEHYKSSDYEKIFQSTHNNNQPVDSSWLENYQRVRYIKNATNKLKNLDVINIGSISRNQMIQELNQAEVLAYPASVVSTYCEGFSVATMEACAAGILPVISDLDALGSLYKDAAVIVKTPIGNKMKEYTELVIRGLLDEKWRKEHISKCIKLSNNYTWRLAAEQYIEIIKGHTKYKGEK